MYHVLLQTREDIIRNIPAVEYHNIRTLSFTSSRILLTDDENKMFCFHPSKIALIGISVEGLPPVHGMREEVDHEEK